MRGEILIRIFEILPKKPENVKLGKCVLCPLDIGEPLSSSLELKDYLYQFTAARIRIYNEESCLKREFKGGERERF